MHDVTIIGAGVAGLWAAHACLDQGIKPRLVDRNGAPGAHGCSWWAGGMLAPYCEGAVAEPEIVKHGAKATSLWAGITPVTRNGTLVLAPERDRREIERFAKRTSQHRSLTAREIDEIEPDLAGRHRRGLFFDTEAHLEPRDALQDLLRSVEARGVTIEKTELDPHTISGKVIDCRGMQAQSDLTKLRGVRGEMVVLRSREIKLKRPVRLLHPRHPLYVVPRANGIFMLGATQIETAAEGPITVRSTLELLSSAYALDPRFAEAELLETGTGLRPAFPDNVPRVVKHKSSKAETLHLNGLFRHGYLMAPILAQQIADYLATGRTGDLIHEN